MFACYLPMAGNCCSARTMAACTPRRWPRSRSTSRTRATGCPSRSRSRGASSLAGNGAGGRHGAPTPVVTWRRLFSCPPGGFRSGDGTRGRVCEPWRMSARERQPSLPGDARALVMPHDTTRHGDRLRPAGRPVQRGQRGHPAHCQYRCAAPVFGLAAGRVPVPQSAVAFRLGGPGGGVRVPGPGPAQWPAVDRAAGAGHRTGLHAPAAPVLDPPVDPHDHLGRRRGDLRGPDRVRPCGAARRRPAHAYR